jgi:hypothetical protein
MGLRQKTSARLRVWAARTGRRVSRVKHQMPKGKIIYSNPNAVPVPDTLSNRQTKHSFSLRNVEWISQREQIGQGGYGVVFVGRIKFKGKKAQRCAVKQFLWWDPKDLNSQHQSIGQMKKIISAVEASKVAHTKMDAFENNGRAYIVMEPFVHSSKNSLNERSIESKFTRNADVIAKMNLKDAPDVALFEDAVRMVSLLAKQKLVLKREETQSIDPKIGLFNTMRLASGRRKLFVQDIDMLGSAKSPKQAWRESTTHLLEALSTRIVGAPAPKEVAHRIISRIGKEAGLV